MTTDGYHEDICSCICSVCSEQCICDGGPRTASLSIPSFIDRVPGIGCSSRYARGVVRLQGCDVQGSDTDK